MSLSFFLFVCLFVWGVGGVLVVCCFGYECILPSFFDCLLLLLLLLLF